MLTSVEAFSVQTALPALTFNIGEASATDTVQLKGFGGDELGPVKADISTEAFGVRDGEAYSGASVGKRNLVATFGLNPDWVDQSIESLRQLLYAYFMPKLPTRLRFHSTHLPTCEISGYVESFAPNMWTKDPEIQVSIICPDPDFVAIEESTDSGVIADGGPANVINYAGSVPAGLILEVHSSAADPDFTGQITIHHYDPTKNPTTQLFVINPVTVDATKFLRMSSVPGDKYVHNVAVSGGAITDLIRGIPASPSWPKLVPGPNTVNIFANDIPGLAAAVGQTWELSWFERFGGL